MTDNLIPVLLVDDHPQYTDSIPAALLPFGYRVTSVSSPEEAIRELAIGAYQAAFIDLLYGESVWEVIEQAVKKDNPLTSRFMTSGLSVVQAANAAGTCPIIFTSGERNRRLHLVLAYEDMRVRSFVSKGTTGGAAHLAQVLAETRVGKECIDVSLGPYLPRKETIPLRIALFGEGPLSKGASTKRAIWRSLALDATSRADIKKIIGQGTGHIGNLVLEMHNGLQSLSSAFRTDKREKFIQLMAFARDNKEFFLDEAVRSLYP